MNSDLYFDNNVPQINFESLDNDLQFESVQTVIGGGDINYNDLPNKPSINGVELVGNKTTNDLGISDEIPTKTSQLENDSNFATKEYVDKEIATFDFIKVVDVLPETGLENRIYFVPKSDTQTQDLFDEWAWINNNWEWITTKQIEVDLTPYARKENYVTLTQDEYDSLETIDAETYYYIVEE